MTCSRTDTHDRTTFTWSGAIPARTTNDEMELDGTILGRYYGYSESAILQHAANFDTCLCKHCEILRCLRKCGSTGTGFPRPDNPFWQDGPIVPDGGRERSNTLLPNEL